jgi:hypothetical protein
MDQRSRFRINRPKIVSETIEGEVIILNLDQGHYFSLRHAGADIWRAVDEGASVAQLVAGLNATYAADDATIETAVLDLLDRCLENDLIVRVSDTGADGPAAATNLVNGSGIGGSKPRFIPPELTKFTDMEDLLLLDPIHEADETGWPQQRAEGAPPRGEADLRTPERARDT